MGQCFSGPSNSSTGPWPPDIEPPELGYGRSHRYPYRYVGDRGRGSSVIRDSYDERDRGRRRRNSPSAPDPRRQGTTTTLSVAESYGSNRRRATRVVEPSSREFERTVGRPKGKGREEFLRMHAADRASQRVRTADGRHERNVHRSYPKPARARNRSTPPERGRPRRSVTPLADRKSASYPDHHGKARRS